MRWLRGHEPAAALADHVAARAAWLTGQSSWTHSLLAPHQHALLDVLHERGWAPLRVGFPWTADAARGDYRPEPLGAASIRNARQYLAAATDRGFAHDVARHLQALLDRTSSDLVLLCGSAGARMLTCAVPHLEVPAGLTVHAVGIGPAGPLPRPGGPWRVTAIRGEADWISRLLHRGPIDRIVPGDHLGAARGAEVRHAVVDLVGAPRPTAPQVGSR